MKTFKELWEYGVELFKTIARLQADNEKAVAKLREAKIYTPSYVADCEKEATEEVLKMGKVLSARFAEAVKETVAAKRAAINQMLTVPPTTEQVNILNALQFQGTAITETEISSVAVQLVGNYRAIHSLQTIAQKAGVRLYLPAQYDFEQLNDILNQVEKYLNDRVQALTNLNPNFRAMDPNFKCFFGVWEGAELESVPFYGEKAILLDGNEQTTPAPTVEKRTLTDEEKEFVETMFSNKDMGTIMKAVLDSPEIRSLVSLHPEYGKLLK